MLPYFCTQQKSTDPVSQVDSDLCSTATFHELRNHITADIVRKIQAVFQFDITKNGKVVQTWSELPMRQL